MKGKMVGQFGKPAGTMGRLAGWIMANSNRQLTDWTIRKLAPAATDHILEVGYGPGVACKKIADRLTTGQVVGIDHSPLMYRMARHRNRRYLRTNKVTLHCGVIDELKSFPARFDIIFANNVHFFWSCPSREFGKLRALLKPGGKLIIVFQPSWVCHPHEVDEMAEKCRQQFGRAGLSNITVAFHPMKPVDAIAVMGIRTDLSDPL